VDRAKLKWKILLQQFKKGRMLFKCRWFLSLRMCLLGGLNPNFPQVEWKENLHNTNNISKSKQNLQKPKVYNQVPNQNQIVIIHLPFTFVSKQQPTKPQSLHLNSQLDPNYKHQQIEQ
jgi:hypothetical protein